MKVRAVFKETGLSLDLLPENEAEQRMIGAVLNLPSSDRQAEVCGQLLMATMAYEGHYTNKRVSSLHLAVMRNEEQSGGDQER